MEQSPSRKAPTPGSWKPGTSGNPRGRPRSGNALTEAIRRAVDPTELLEIALDLARNGESESTRLQALAWLRDSGFTRPAEKHEHTLAQPQHDDGDDVLELLSEDELGELEMHTAARDVLLARARDRRDRPALPAGTGLGPIGVGAE